MSAEVMTGFSGVLSFRRAHSVLKGAGYASIVLTKILS